ncbi:T9SS type A sorting domain-containing protein [Chryseobacterium sp. ISL-6]|uniref:T9SS type A sorting domain-containing protein n=1 Tax=Chryseobacterium sp. ISL-6 TaxID=2819143 RepID=UPI001BE640EB|nr:T9SS type A sorting domain-containing protein [Chryseobacterium sp. ISL-6]MBT2620221.1 T9SS type A sorting domain-containing protein [Chryseobacterium sp. ISL-6]
MKKLLLSCMLALGIGASAQILVNESFEGSSLPSGWTSSTTGTGSTSSPSGYGTSAGTPCAGSKAVYKNIYGTTYTGWNVTYTSTASNATALTYSFKYLATGYGSTGPISGSVAADYSVDGGTNWVDLLSTVTLDSPNGTPIPCTAVSGIIPAGTIPTGASFKLRLKSTSTATGDFYMGFDDVQLSQTVTSAPVCTTISAPANAATGISITPTITWAVAGGATSYTLNVGTTAGGTDIINGLDVGSVTSYTMPSATPLAYSTQYYVTIIPKNSIGSATGCTGNSFTTITMPCPSVSSPPGTATGVSTIPTFAWSSVTGATGYKITLGTTSGGTDILNNTDLGNVTSYTMLTSLNPSTVYYYTITSYNAVTNSGTCTERSFTTTSVAPPINDNCGNATVLTVNADLACGVVTAGKTLGASLSMAATPCNGNPDDDVWFSFVASGPVHVVKLSDVVSTGTTSTTDMYFQVLSGVCGSQTSVLCSDPNSATVSGLTAGETYYVRVYTYSGSGYNASFNICVGTPPPPPSNDNCANPIPLTVGGTFDTNFITTTNVGATADGTAQSCQTSATNNVWYSVVVPASGTLKIETNSVAGSTFSDSVINVFSGTCGSLTNVSCDDDSSADGNFSFVSLTGQTPGATLLVSVWRYSSGTGTDGEFKISAYDASLLGTNEVSNNKNNLKVYPNPFADVLNISDVSKVKSISVSDVAGRLVKTVINPSSTLQLGELKSGMYLVTLEMKDGSKQTIKTIKK